MWRLTVLSPQLLALGCTADKGDADAAATDADADTDADTDAETEPGTYFPGAAPWYTDVRSAAVDVSSPSVIGWLDGAGWGNGRFQIDFSLEVLTGATDTPFMEFQTTGDFYSPDCDHVPMPVPDGGRLEGESGYACTHDGDCHLLVAHWPTQRLYEMWRANLSGSTFRGGCLAVWDMATVYPPEGRGDQCTSADAAGYPITPLLPTADEVAAGEVAHALRFILPNTTIREGVFVHPASHSTGSASGPASAPPYGAQLRLRADYPLDTLPNEAARVIARALQTYGMFLADGGTVALTFQADTDSTAKWAALLASHDLEGIQPADFELLAMPDPIALTYDCTRTPLTE